MTPAMDCRCTRPIVPTRRTGGSSRATIPLVVGAVLGVALACAPVARAQGPREPGAAAGAPDGVPTIEPLPPIERPPETLAPVPAPPAYSAGAGMDEGVAVEHELHTVAVTFSPVHLLFPLVELTAEARVGERIGIAAILGVGVVFAEEDGTVHLLGGDGADRTLAMLDLGAQFRFYAVGDFDHGLQVGSEVLYLYVQDTADAALGAGQGLSVAGFLGYKYTAPFGLTVDVQAGPALVALASREEDESGASDDDSALVILPMVNLNVGWAF